MQHQQQMTVPEREDVLRLRLDVLDVDVADAQRGVERADEERGDEGEKLHLFFSLSRR